MQSQATFSKADMTAGSMRVPTGTFPSFAQESNAMEVRSFAVELASNNSMR